MIDQEILNKIQTAPKFSDSALKLIRVISSGNYSANDIINIIKFDHRLTALVLKIVNSAHFGMSRNVDSIHTAVTLLGSKRIMAVAQEVYSKMYLDKPLNGYECDGMWQHSLRTALAAAELAPLCRPEVNKEQAFTTGILHDIGKTVLSDFLGNTSRKFIDAIDKHRIHNYLEAETDQLGTDHAQVGEMLAHSWNLPDFICNAILYHHRPKLAEDRYKPISYVIHMADIIAMLSCSDQGSDSLLYEVDETYVDYFPLTGEQINQIIFSVDQEFETIQESMRDAGL